MCGITGFFLVAPQKARIAPLTDMVASLHHRGPDGQGTWIDEQSGMSLGHARLAVLDLSPAGHQPMASASGRYVLVFNGEIYNHLELRERLTAEGGAIAWRGHSDTETLLAGFAHWGVATTLKRTVGMFAIALWDRDERCLYLARDRLGEKPLYYGWQGKAFLFGSELKALQAHPSFEGVINRDALSAYFRHCTVPAPHCIYVGIHKIVPGTCLRVTESEMLGETAAPAARSYWSLEEAIENRQRAPFAGGPGAAVEELHQVLRRAVAAQMVADVPLGAFLSGGVDSSTIVALMQAQSAAPIKTFTIGFDDVRFNEAEHASAVAKHLGTDHTELYVSPQQALDVIPLLPTLYDEPFGGASQIPTYLVSKLARGKVTVSLSGDAGDELFGGYRRYALAQTISRRLSILPRAARRGVTRAVRSLDAERWEALASPALALAPKRFRLERFGDRLHKLADLLAEDSFLSLYRRMVSTWTSPESLVLGSHEPSTLLADRPLPGASAIERLMALDTLTYLPDDILVKVDRAGMGVSLESRIPLLDHRVVEFAWSLPYRYKVRQGVSKWVLREVLYKYVPRAMIERPKMGFGVPVDAWLRGPLRGWAEDLLNEKRLREEGFLNASLVRAKWSEHLSGARNWPYHLWCVLMFQQWLNHAHGKR